MKTLFFIRQIIRKYFFHVFNNTFFLFIASLIDAVTIFSLVVIFDLFFNPSLKGASPITQKLISFLQNVGLPISLVWILVIFLFLAFLKTAIQIFAQCLILKTKYAILRDITLETFSDFFNARWYFFSSNKQGTLLNTFTRELGIVSDAVGTLGFSFCAILQAAMFLAVPFYLSWKLTLIVMATAFILALPFLLLGRISYRLGKLSTSTANEFNKVIQESLSYTKLILGFGNQDKLNNDLQNAYDMHCRVTLKAQTLTRSLPLLYLPISLVTLVIGIIMSRKIALPLSETMVLFYSLSRVVPVLGTVIGHKSSLDNFFPSYEQIMNLRNRAKELEQSSGTKKFEGFGKGIYINSLFFNYPDHPPILKNINMFIPKGKMVAIVGDSGAGKSTLIDMIIRFNDPISGEIKFDNLDSREFDIKSFRKCIGYVPQDSILFNTTIKENLFWANGAADNDDIVNACQLANAEEFIRNLPNGYETIVGDRGVRLSGGQVQRIALARAILRKPDLLILDEATSALDTYSERMIQSAIENIAKNTTVIMVAHRLSTIVNVNYIYVLKDGEIVEEGNFIDLTQREGKFKKMVQLQSLEISK